MRDLSSNIWAEMVITFVYAKVDSGIMTKINQKEFFVHFERKY